MMQSVIAFPGEKLGPGRMVDAMDHGEVKRVSSSTVTHQVEHPADLYGPTTNLLPFLNGMQGNRVLMASKHQSQALPLIYREEPLVQVSSWSPGRTVGHEMVRRIVPTAPVAGTIEKIDQDYIYLRPHGTKQNAYVGHTDHYTPHGTDLSDETLSRIRLELSGEVDSIKVYKVDGAYIRNHIDIEFALAGNPGRYKFIPDGEVWIEAAIEERDDEDARAIVTHELTEYRRMKEEHEAYEKAHEHANTAEGQIRKTAADDKGLIKLHSDTHFPLAAKTYLHNTITVKEGDRVVAGQPLADSNFTRNGNLALGTNLRVAYIPYRGLNSNDGVVVSQGAADRLVSEHMYKHTVPLDIAQLGRDKHRAYFGAKYSGTQYNALDEHGVIKPGTVVQKGDPLIAAFSENKLTGNAVLLGKLSKSLVKPYRDEAETWEHDMPGEVIDCVRTPSRVMVTVKTREPLQIGDKLCGQSGNKGVVSKIVPDQQMLHDEKDRPIDILLTSAGIVSRTNPAQIIEAALGKVAEHIGKPVIVDQFDKRDNVEMARALLAKHGLKDKETIHDPVTGKDIPGIMVGKAYFLKLFKTTDSNWSAHGAERYDVNQQPARGGDDGAKAIGMMEFNGLVAHNARNILRESSSIKSQKNDEFWRAIQLGLPAPAPKTTFAYDKFLNMLQGAGVKVSKAGSQLALGPLTDNDITKMSSGALPMQLANKILRAKDLAPESGGLFDPVLTGGTSGTKWSHVELHEPIVNPVFEEPVRRLLGLTQQQFRDLHGEHGGTYFRNELSKIDLDKRRSELLDNTKRMKGVKLDDAVKQLKYLSALKAQGLKPADAYVLSKVPVTPPIIRPILPLRDGTLEVGDANLLYRDAFLANKQLADAKGVLPSNMLKDPRLHLYDAVSAVFGLGDPVSPTAQKRGAKGYLAYVTGTRPGSGFFQSKLMRRQQDVSGRATIAPDPTLSMDEVGIPSDMLHQMYGKFVIGRLVKRGYSATDAQKMVDDKHPVAQQELLNESRERPVFINRAPSLTRHNIIAAYPKLLSGKTILLNPFAERGLNADYDGDCQFGSVVIGLMNKDYCDLPAADLYWWEQRAVPPAMTARFKTVVGYALGTHFFICALEDFPRTTLQFEKDHRKFFNVPKGVQVVAHDPVTHALTLMPVSSWSVHQDRQVEIVTLASGHQIITDDDPRAVYGVNRDLTIMRTRPREAEAQKIFVPVARNLSLTDAALQELQTGPGGHRTTRDGSINFREKRLLDAIQLDANFGHLCGLLVGDGWVDPGKGVNLAAIEPGIRTRYQDLLLTLFPVVPSTYHQTREGEGYGLISQKIVVSSVEYARFMEPLIGHLACYKHLPPFFLFTPEAFRRGLLAGLFDTDGSIAISNAKKKPQWIINHSTTSLRLAREIVMLYKSFSIRAGICNARTPHGGNCWIVTPSSVELRKLQHVDVAHVEKAKRFAEYFAEASNDTATSYTRTDIVPIPRTVALQIAECYQNASSMYVTFNKATHTGYTTRVTAKKALLEQPQLRNEASFARWISFIENTSIMWDRVVSYKVTNQVETGHDLTVPGSETFMAVDGTILSNTIQVHAPVTAAGVADAKTITLSHLLFTDRLPGQLNVSPDMEAIIGLHKTTRPGTSGKVKKFKSKEDALAAYHAGQISLSDPVEIGS